MTNTETAQIARDHLGIEYFSGYLLEKALSVDNLFVFLVIMSSFAVPRKDQQKVLLFGIVFALIARSLFIFLGMAIIDNFTWAFYVFGLILLLTAGKLLAPEKEGEQLKKGTEITLTVSKGPEPIRFPDLVDAPAEEAKKQLDELGFEVKSSEEHSSTVEAGRVIRQDPRTGEGKRGDTVNLVVSLGPEMIEIPSVRLKSSGEAEKILKDLGFEVAIERNSDFPIPLDLASGTDPGEGKTAPKGSTITLFVT